MRTAIVSLKSSSPYSQSKVITSPKLDRERPDQYEERCWRERMHATDDGRVFIPPTVFKNGLSDTAKFKAMRVPGKGTATYTKNFEAGVLVVEPLVLPIKRDDVPGERLFVPSDGKRGGGKRVWKVFPLIASWSGDVEFIVIDNEITEDVFRQHVEDFGRFIGIGRFRPRNNGFYGRFTVEGIEWIEMG